MIDTMLRGLPCLFALAACDEAFDLEHVPEPMPTCTDFAIKDDFTSSQACAGWGNVYVQSAELVVAAGHLTITTSMPGGYGTCTAFSSAVIPAAGIFTEVSDMHGDAWFGIKTATDRLLIYAGYGAIKLSTKDQSFGTVTWDPVAMRWWRLRADPDAGVYVAEYGRDGKQWTAFGGFGDWPIEDAVQLTIGAGIADQTTPQATTFEGVNVCTH